MTIKIFLADDHPLIMDGLRLVLDNEPDMEVIGQAEDGLELVRQAARLKPDVVIADITMPELNGLEAARRIREQCASCRVIILSMHGTVRHVRRAVEAGAGGYLLKGTAGQEVIRAVRNVAQGHRYLSRKLTRLVEEADLSTKQATIDPLLRLSDREREVLQLVVEGHTNAAIAEKLHLSPKTVATYRSRLMQKLDMPDLPSLVKFALDNRLTPPQ